jgi:hypothetical protein
MAIIKPRNRVVIFRVTQEEYSHLETACTIGGARSLSDFARSRVLSGPEPPPVLSQVEVKLDELKSAVEMLATRLVEKS